VRDLSETTTLISVKVDVINVEGGSLKRRNAEEVVVVKGDTAVSENIGGNVALILLTELYDNFNFVVLHLKYPIFRCIYI